MARRLVVAVTFVVLAACNSGPVNGPDAGGSDAGVDGGHLAQGSAAFLDSDVAVLTGAAHPRLGRDARGVLHALYSGTANDGTGTSPVRYGECASGCTSASAWTFITLADHAPAGGQARQARLLVLPSGGVRTLHFKRGSDLAPAVLVYGQCDSACTTAASWTTGELKSLPNLDALTVGPEPLAVDAQGQLRLVFSLPTGFTYGTCDTGCTSPSSWTWLTLGGVPAEAPTLVLTSSGQPRVLAGAPASNGDSTVELLSCDANCALSAVAWTQTSLFWGKPRGRLAFKSDAQGRLRALVYQDVTGRADVAATDHHALFAFCDAACTTQAGWGVESLGLAAHAGELGLDLVFDGARTNVLFTNPTEPAALSLAWCTNACTTTTAAWQVRTVESADDVQLAEAAPLTVTCDGGVASWVPGLEVSALSVPDGGGVDLVHAVDDEQVCATTRITGGARPRYAHLAP